MFLIFNQPFGIRIWPLQTYPRLSRLPRPAEIFFRFRGGIGNSESGLVK